MKPLGKKVKREHLTIDEDVKSWKYMYQNVPTTDITLEKFEQFAYDRLKLLKQIELFRSKKPKHENFTRQVNAELSSLIGNDIEKDYISHHILRLAFSKTDTQRNWFRNMEAQMFEIRLESDPASLPAILEYNGVPIIKYEKETHVEAVRLVHDSQFPMSKLEKTFEIWQADWINVLSLVSNRRVYIQDGNVYLTRSNLVQLLSQNFRDKLTTALEKIFKVWPYLEQEEGERLVPFLNKFGNKLVDSQYKVSSNTDGSIALENLDALSATSYPLCMRNLHQHLRQDHHLKHQGRLQYGLFLKGIGLSMEMAMEFWKMEMTQKMTESDFVKNYSYNFRHQFGIEGKKTNYTPYGCTKIIMGNAPMGSDAHHGCPFKHMDAGQLKNMIGKDVKDIEEIMDLVSHQHYQVACTKYFDATHPMKHEFVPITHPNQYFDLSRKLTTGTSVKKEETSK